MVEQVPKAILDGLPNALEIRVAEGKGLGVFAHTSIQSFGAPIGQYSGRVIFDEASLDNTNEYLFAVYGFDTLLGSDRRPERLRPLFWVDASSASLPDDDDTDSDTPIDRSVETSDGRGSVRVHLEADEQRSSWSRYVNSVLPTNRDESPNVEYFEYQQRIYIRATRPIQAGEEILSDYGVQYWLVDLKDCRLQRVRRTPDKLYVDAAVARLRSLLPESFRVQAVPTLRAYVSSPFNNVFVLYERGSDRDVGFVVVTDSTVIALRTIEVLNADDVRRRLLDAVDDFIVMRSRREFFAVEAVFNSNDEIASRFSFEPATTTTTKTTKSSSRYYRRLAAIVSIEAATQNELSLLFNHPGGDTQRQQKQQLPIECTEVWHAFPYGQLVRVQGGIEASQYRVVIVRRRTGDYGIVAVAVERTIDRVLMVVCIFDRVSNLYSDNNTLMHRYVFDEIVTLYQQALVDDGRTRSGVFALDVEPQERWLETRGYKRSRRRTKPVPVVPSTVYLERTLPKRPIVLVNDEADA